MRLISECVDPSPCECVSEYSIVADVLVLRQQLTSNQEYIPYLGNLVDLMRKVPHWPMSLKRFSTNVGEIQTRGLVALRKLGNSANPQNQEWVNVSQLNVVKHLLQDGLGNLAHIFGSYEVVFLQQLWIVAHYQGIFGKSHSVFGNENGPTPLTMSHIRCRQDSNYIIVVVVPTLKGNAVFGLYFKAKMEVGDEDEASGDTGSDVGCWHSSCLAALTQRSSTLRRSKLPVLVPLWTSDYLNSLETLA